MTSPWSSLVRKREMIIICDLNISSSHQQYHVITVLIAILRETNKSRMSPILSSRISSSLISSIEMFLPLTRAILEQRFVASFVLPFTISQRRDSGVILSQRKLQVVVLEETPF